MINVKVLGDQSSCTYTRYVTAAIIAAKPIAPQTINLFRRPKITCQKPATAAANPNTITNANNPSIAINWSSEPVNVAPPGACGLAASMTHIVRYDMNATRTPPSTIINAPLTLTPELS